MTARKLINFRWTDWDEHDGKGCPFPDGLFVECDFENEPGDFELGWGLTGADGGATWDDANWLTTDERGFSVRRVRAYRVRLVDCPALTERSSIYPVLFGGLVPVLVRLPRKVEADPAFAGDRVPPAGLAQTYTCWVDRDGGLTVVFRNDKQLFLASHQFEVLAAFNPATGLVERIPKIAPYSAKSVPS